MVLLDHMLPSGERHLDWLIARDGHEGPLASMRMGTWPLAGVNAVAVEPAADHDRAWLTCEGAVSGKRGHATRIDTGELVSVQVLPEGLGLAVRWTERGVQSLLLASSGGGACLRAL